MKTQRWGPWVSDKGWQAQEPLAPEEAVCSLLNLGFEVGFPTGLRWGQTYLDVEGEKMTPAEECLRGHLHCPGCRTRPQAHTGSSWFAGSPLPASTGQAGGHREDGVKGRCSTCIAGGGGGVGVGAGPLLESGS